MGVPAPCREVHAQAAVGFRRDLRTGRLTALGDSEGYFELVIAIEALGRYLTIEPKSHNLAAYSPALVALAERVRDSASFRPMLDAFRHARNDAAHIGAAARRITHQATDVALVLEEALAHEGALQLVEHFMVEHVICAESWQTVSMVRQTLLRMQFSMLPFRQKDTWHLVTDEAVVRFLAKDRNRRLALTLEQAVLEGIDLPLAHTVPMGSAVDPLRSGPNRLPVLVVDKQQNLHGLITAFDIL